MKERKGEKWRTDTNIWLAFNINMPNIYNSIIPFTVFKNPGKIPILQLKKPQFR